MNIDFKIRDSPDTNDINTWTTYYSALLENYPVPKENFGKPFEICCDEQNDTKRVQGTHAPGTVAERVHLFEKNIIQGKKPQYSILSRTAAPNPDVFIIRDGQYVDCLWAKTLMWSIAVFAGIFVAVLSIIAVLLRRELHNIQTV